MTKRIFALLLTLVMVFSTFALASCDKKGSDDEGEESQAPLTTKELFVASVVNAISGSDYQTLKSLMKFDDAKANVKVQLNKLEYEGEDFLNGSSASVELEGAIDLDNKAIQLKAGASIFGESPSATLIADTNAIYAVDVLGLNKKPIKLTYEEMGIDVDDLFEEFGMVEAEIEKATEILEFVTETITDAVKNNFSEDKFQVENKAVTVEGKEFADAKVITLNIDSKLLKAFLDEILTKFIENEDFMEIIGEDIDKEELLEDLDEFGKLNIVNTIVDNKTVALNIDFKALSDEAKEPEYDEDGYANVARAGAELCIRCTFVDKNVKIHIGQFNDEGEIDPEQGVIKLEYIVDGNNEKLELYFDEEGDKNVLISATGTCENGKHKGTLTTMIDGSDVSIDYELEGTLLDTKLKISNVKVTAQGETVEFPIEIALDYEIGKSKVETSIGVKLEYEGLKLDAVISFKEETTDVNIQIPTNAVTVKELDMDEVQGWLTDAQKKYPKIFDFITDTIGSMSSGPSYDNNYDDDSYYEDDFYFDVEDDYDFYYGGLASGF